MNKAITEGLVLMPPPFSAGLNLWSREDGRPGQGSYAGQANAALVTADADFAGCLELQKIETTQRLRCFQQIPMQPGLYLKVTARIKAISGALPSVRIAGWAGSSSGSNVTSADQQGPSVALTGYGQVVEVSAIIGSGNRQGVDMVWGLEPVYGHIGLDLTGANNGIVRIDDVSIEDVSAIFHSVLFDWVDVRDFGAIGDGVTNDYAAFAAADAAASGKRVVVPPGNYYIASNLTFENPVQFEGTLIMPAAVRLICTRNYNLDTYAAAFGDELAGFKKALQALFYYTDHVQLDLSGRRVELSEPIDVAALAGLTTFAQRRQVANGQFSVLEGAAWDTVTVTATATYATSQTARLTAVTNLANIPVGARVAGPGVGREVYVKSKNVSAGTIELSRPLVGGDGTRSLTFRRFQYMFDFGGFAGLSKFEFSNLEFLCNGLASCINLGLTGDTFKVVDCVINKPRDKAITSTGEGCQDLIIDQCQFISNEQELPVESRTTIVYNCNANDTKIRNNRASRWAHFGVVAGSGHIFLGNHFFGGDDFTSGVRKAGLVLTDINVKSFITGNYIDNSFIELTNEHDDRPNNEGEFSFGGLTVTGNTFTAANVAPWFRWLVVSPYGSGHYVSGLTVSSNVFRVISASVDRIEAVDTTYGTLAYTSFRNVIFENNSFTNVSQPTSSPVMVEHTQSTASDTWVVDASAYLPFASRARNVVAMVAEGAISNASNVAQNVMPWVSVEQGTAGNLVNIRWSTAVKGKMQVTLRCDNPV